MCLTLEMSKPILLALFKIYNCQSRYSNWLGDALTAQSEIILQSDLVRHRFHSGCQQIDNLCFASMINIDFDQVLIIGCFYKCVTLEIQIC